ncbi:MAG: peroxiredoxin-like family protein [Pseudolabrys sp.]
MSDQGKPVESLAEALAQASSLPGDLTEKLAAYLAHSRRLRPDFVAAYDRLIAHLELLYSGRIGPAVGDRMPDFLLPDQQGALVSLDGLLKSGPVVISMNRGHWCPYCKLDLRALADAEPEIRRMGAQLVSIMPDKAKFSKKAVADNHVPFRILSDIDLSYALSLGLIYWVGPEIKQLYDDLGLDLEDVQGNRSYFLPMAAKFIVSGDGVIKAREVDIDFRQRMGPRAILAALANL